jgi:hypothetical protein
LRAVSEFDESKNDTPAKHGDLLPGTVILQVVRTAEESATRSTAPGSTPGRAAITWDELNEVAFIRSSDQTRSADEFTNPPRKRDTVSGEPTPMLLPESPSRAIAMRNTSTDGMSTNRSKLITEDRPVKIDAEVDERG